MILNSSLSGYCISVFFLRDHCIFGRSFVKWFTLCHQNIVCPVWPLPSVMLLYCRQTAGWIKMPFGTEVGLCPFHMVLDGNPSPPKGAQQCPPLFGPCPLRPNGCMDQDATWYGGRPRPRRHCVRWGPSSPSTQKGRAASTFQPTALSRVAGGPHFTHNSYYRLGSAWRVALVAILRIIMVALCNRADHNIFIL